MPHQELYDNLFPGNSENSNPEKLLQEVINEYPYFSLPHFLLLQQTPASDLNYPKIAAKTALYFNNPFLLKYQLLRKSEEVSKVSEVEEVCEVEEVSKVEKVSEVEEVSKVEEIDANAKQENKKEELLFEPLHTTDYFASQGIRLSEEAQHADKLGKQLRSFTDWLKTMKKKGPGRLPETNAGIDAAVQNLAEKSNKEQEVLTESMAEVYIQQGKTEKASDIYKKLSLLNPAKNVYFAAKIDLLKDK